MSKISIKKNPELRHALAHMYYAIECLTRGKLDAALFELESIEGLIFWDDDRDMERSLEGYIDNQESDDGEVHEEKEQQDEQDPKELQG